MRVLRPILLLLLLLRLCGASFAEGIPDTAVVQVTVTYQEYDPFVPWQKAQPKTRSGYAVAIEPDRLITTEDLVRNATLIELRKLKSGQKFIAMVEHADYQVNVATLKIADPARAGGLTPVSLATNVSRDAVLQAVQFDETGDLQQRDARIVKITVSQLPASPNVSLTFLIQTDMSVNAPGAPMFFGDALAGLVMRYDRGTRTGMLLPYRVLQRFRDDVAQDPYPGLPSAGFLWTSLVDPAKREFLGAPDDDKGILILSVLPGSGASETLKADDVILEWDGRELDNLGYYDDPEFGRLYLPYLIGGRRRPGETVPLTIIRDRQKQVVNVKLMRRLNSDALIPENVLGEASEYCADAGYVIRELTGEYLRSAGPVWELAVNPRLVDLYWTHRHNPASPGDRIVILSRVLPHPINIGYQFFRGEIVTAVNRQPVRNMQDVFRILEADRGLRRISLRGSEVDIVVDQEEIHEANPRLAAAYDIPCLRFRRPAR